MLNFEKYRNDILNTQNSKLAVDKDGHLTKCSLIQCDNCKLYNDNDTCSLAFAKWLYEEATPEVDWTSVAVDTPVYVREVGTEEWRPRYFSHYADGRIYVWACGATSWTATDTISWAHGKLAE